MTNYFKISEKCPFNASKYFSFQISNFKLLLFTTKSLQRAWISGAPDTIFKWYAQSWHESWHEECWSSLLKSFAKGGWQDFELYKGSSLALFNLDKDKVSRTKTGFSSSCLYKNSSVVLLSKNWSLGWFFCNVIYVWDRLAFFSFNCTRVKVVTYSFCIQCHRECALKWTLCVHNSNITDTQISFSFSMSVHKMPVIYNHFEKVLGNSVSVWLLFMNEFCVWLAFN